MRRDTRAHLTTLALLLGLLFAAPTLRARQTPAQTKPSPQQQDGEERKAQDALYQKFLANFRGGPAEQKIAYKAAREYLSKYGDQQTPENVRVLDYLRNWAGKYEEATVKFERWQKDGVISGGGMAVQGLGTGDGTPPRDTVRGVALSRLALVIGNAAYKGAPLRDPVNDAREVAWALSRLGFVVIEEENLSREQLERAVRDFGRSLRRADVGLFYYSGHAVQSKGTNYLVPVDADIDGEEEVKDECVDAGLVLAQTQGARNHANIVILDASRDNAFARGFVSAAPGLAAMDAPRGTLIAYAATPNTMAADVEAGGGLYTRELLKNIGTPGLSIAEVFARVRQSVRGLTAGGQTPWESSALAGDFYISGTRPAP